MSTPRQFVILGRSGNDAQAAPDRSAVRERARRLGWFLPMLALLAAPVAWGAGTEEGAAAEERMTISWLGTNAGGELLERDTPVELHLEELFDVELEPWGYEVSHGQEEQWRVRIASGDLPDFNVRWREDLVHIGAVREVPEEMLLKHMPRYMKQAAELGGDILYHRTTVNGKNMGIPAVLSIAAAGPGMVIRKDWLDAIGHQTTPVPGTYIYEGPDTLAELEDIFRKFRNDDPDGNGQRDTFGLMPYQGGGSIGDRAMFFPNILGAFGIRLNTWEKMGDDIGFSQLRPAYRDALQYLNEWYEQELIHPEFVVTDSADMRQKFGNGLIGAFESWSAQLTNPSTNQAWGMLKANNPEIDPVIVVSPEGPSGMRGTYSRSAVWSPSSVGANVSDEKLAKILEILDEMYSNTDLFATAFYGIEGTHWNYSEAGDPIRAEGWTAPASFMKSGATYFRLTAVPTSVEFLYMGGNTWRYPVNSYIVENQVSLDFGFLPTLDEEFLVLSAEVKTVEDEFFFKAIAGEVDIAAGWDDYVAAWRNAGGDRLLAEITRQYRASK